MKPGGSGINAEFRGKSEVPADTVVDFESGKSRVHARTEEGQTLKTAKRGLLQEAENSFKAEIAREERGLAEYLLHSKRITETAISRGQDSGETVDIQKLEHNIPIMVESRRTLKRQIQESISRAGSMEELNIIRNTFDKKLAEFRENLNSLEELLVKGRSFK